MCVLTQRVVPPSRFGERVVVRPPTTFKRRVGRVDIDNVRDWRNAWAVWIVATVAAVPASAVLWFVGGMSFCGEEDYNTPPGSVGDTLCTTLVHPIIPWASLAAIPFLIAAVGGFVGIRQRKAGLFQLAVSAPFVVVVLAVFAVLAIF